ncbi:hypothetical protein PACTADRAFT_51655 [Pachysolen tannophilus NRRL Y-2460]|uniref:Dipeptidyl-peptidase IV n=1 Tax=Pachysolen tannophilus NRRL Y-2460 TaxID=669874 RepID=A0A1E4TQ74_PACTA|nr:hypothetical protein PACTADRAFT_51655 [Pachysolen tannophilus NRRL Y-2460]
MSSYYRTLSPVVALNSTGGDDENLVEEKSKRRDGEELSNGVGKDVHKRFFSIGLLLCALIYGSAFLVSGVNQLYYNSQKSSSSSGGKTTTTTASNNDDAHVGPFLVPKALPLTEGGGEGGKNDQQALLLSQKIPLSFDLVRNDTFKPEFHSIQWIKSPDSFIHDKGTYVVDNNNTFTIKSISDKQFSSVLFSGSVVSYGNVDYKVEDIIASPDLNYALIITDKKRNWRHSFFANYFVYNVEEKSLKPLYEDDLNSKISLAQWSPLSNTISFVLKNNVYLYNVTSATANQITFDGNEEIFYGKPDWVYEEEVFESDSAMWWSPNGEYLAILRSNDTLVPEFPIPYFVQNDENDGKIQSYPVLKKIKYPKAGYPNPVVDILIYGTNSKELMKLGGNDVFYNDKDIKNDDRLITEVFWVGDYKVFTKITNRESDLMKMFLINTKSMSSTVSRSELANEDGGWFEITDNTFFVPKDLSKNRLDDGYIDTIVVDGFNHLAYFSPPESAIPKTILTNGSWEVVDAPSAFDYEKNIVYFISTEKSPVDRHLYAINLLDPSIKKNITNVEEEAWFSVSFSSGSRYVLLDYNGPNVPYQKLIDLHDDSIEIVEDNNKLKQTLEKYDLPQIRYGQINLQQENDDEPIIANYKETLPLNFDASKKYPLLFFVYGGPNSQLITKVFATSFSSIVAAELDAVVVTVDGRGTPFMGRRFRSIVRDKLGYYESIDQISAAKIWTSKDYIDSEKVAIWGWSYGGFMTLKTLETDAGEFFKYGMSVAPVTNWNFYDSIYTERYMHTPSNNPEGYLQSSIRNVTNIAKAKRFLVMHGTGDDNVHFQNFLKVVDLFDINKVENYDIMVFPDSDHSISWHNGNIIVYDKLLNWLRSAFRGDFDRSGVI